MLSPFKALATWLELEQQCITPENKKGIPPSHKHELYTACSQCYDFSRNREKNPFGSFPLETNISYYHCLYLIKIFKIPVLLQFGSSQNLKVWGFVTCNHLTSKLDKHQPKQHPCYSSGKGAAASHRLGWAGWSYWFCGSGVFSCILTFPLLPGWFLNMFFPASLIPSTPGSYTDFWLFHLGLGFLLCQNSPFWNIFWSHTFALPLSPNTLVLGGCHVLSWLQLPCVSQQPPIPSLLRLWVLYRLCD